MLNFESLAKKFLSITQAMKISSNAQCLYFQILNFYNSKFWPDKPLEIDNMTIHNVTGLSRKQILFARTELQRIGILYYEKGVGSHSGKYGLIDISNAKIPSIIELENLEDVKIDNLASLGNEVDKLVGDNKIWGHYILRVLQKSIQNNVSGIYANYYTTTQIFLKASDTMKLDTLYKIIMHVKLKPDIQNKEAYILTIVANEVRQMQKNRQVVA